MAKLKKGDIVFFNWNNIGSIFVQIYNRLKYNKTGPTHVGVIGSISGDDVIIYEALSKGFTASAYSIKSLEEQKGKVWFGRSKSKLSNIEETLEKYPGKPYGWLSILSVALSWFLKFKINIDLSNSVICSEATAKFLYDASNKKVNIAKEFDKPYQLVTPMDIFKSKHIKVI